MILDIVHYKKISYLALALSLQCLSTDMIYAQKVNYDEVIKVEGGRPKDFVDYLAQLAWLNTANNRVLEAKKDIAENNLRHAKNMWLEGIGANTNINYGNDTIIINNDPFLRPGFNFGFSINLGGVINNRFKKKTALHEITIAKNNINQQKLKLRALVHRAYYKFKLANKILKSRSQSEEDLTAAYTIARELFKTNKTEIDEYTSASTAYFNAVEKRQLAEFELQAAQVDLEELIGVDWDVVARFDPMNLK